MPSSPRSHLYRLIVLLVIVITGFLWVKRQFVPESWDTQHWYRRGALKDLKHLPISYGGNASCTSGCHDAPKTDHVAIASALASSVHAHLSCEFCHGPLHAGEHTMAAAQIPRDSRLCLRCHDAIAARPARVGLFSETVMAHQSLGVKRDSNCVRCHDPHAPRPKAVVAEAEPSTQVSPALMALVAGCNSCHKPRVPVTPLLAGQSEQYLRAVMLQLRDGSLGSLIMGDILRDLSEEQIDALAKYYGGAEWVSVQQETNHARVTAGAAVHLRRCAGCHGPGGRQTLGLIPRLAGQQIDYIRAQLKTYQDPRSKLPNEVMRTVLRGLSPRDLDALAQFYAAAPKIPPAHTEDIHVIAPGCDSCHHQGFPDMANIRGQGEEYLNTVMLQQRDGSRTSSVMQELLTAYSDRTIGDLARYYAASQWASSKEKTDAELVKAGAKLHASRCAGCHGPDARTTQGTTPRLAGQSAGYIEGRLKAYQDPSIKLPNKTMRTVAKNLSSGDIKALAQFYAAHQPQPVSKAPPAEAAAPAPSSEGGDLSAMTAECDGCHRPRRARRIPMIAGQPEQYLRNAMHEQRDGARDSPIMGGVLKGYSDQQIAALARHYAEQKWVSAPAQKMDEEAIKMGATLQQRCAGCHGERGLKPEGMTPRLAGQAAGFLEAELNRYRDASVKRPNAMMRTLAQTLKPAEVKALAAYYSVQSEDH